ncbi:hypothetical protein KQX54_017596 [Cotesia glomerata]|uniref:Uncharacterized protein n=1 Tax=Cotesia glomerata TaxID=32391 RepID=A0AAV7ICP8_COTGL|nr:hypothetical protein KQX54_017596 [Cotesia glomerata]
MSIQRAIVSHGFFPEFLNLGPMGPTWSLSLLVSGKWVLADRVLVRWEHGSFCLAVGPPSFFIYLFGPSGQPPESSRELANDHEAHSLDRELRELCRDKSDLPKPLGQAVEIFLISTSIEHTPPSCIF